MNTAYYQTRYIYFFLSFPLGCTELELLLSFHGGGSQTSTSQPTMIFGVTPLAVHEGTFVLPDVDFVSSLVTLSSSSTFILLFVSFQSLGPLRHLELKSNQPRSESINTRRLIRKSDVLSDEVIIFSCEATRDFVDDLVIAVFPFGFFDVKLALNDFMKENRHTLARGKSN